MKNIRKSESNALIRISARACAVIICAGTALLIAGCPVETTNPPQSNTYICENGTPVTGTAPAPDTVGCQECTTGYTLDGTAGPGTVCGSVHTCENGTPISDAAAAPGTVGCQECTTGYALDGAAGPGTVCAVDTDRDSVIDSVDVDNDNDGLIDINTLTELHNMRYNLDGTSYKTSGTDGGSTAGAPTAPTSNCTTATDGVYLCGYELLQNLDFDLDGDGSTVEADGSLDDDDDAAPYFVVSDGGWEPVGDSTNLFDTLFEGNGFTISNLAILRDQDFIGFFGGTDAESHIRNIGLVGGLVAYSGSAGGTAAIYIGSLVGNMFGTITTSYATGNVVGGEENDRIGGLVGEAAGIIIASFATGNVVGNGGNDRAGGLVGRVDDSRSRVDASYATGNVTGNGDNDFVGGLVGLRAQGFITASYATGDVDAGAGTTDRAGALGVTFFQHTAISYGFGEVTNEESIGGVSPKPAGVSAATGLTAANAVECSNPTYTSETVCTATTLTVAAGSWSTADSACSAPMTGATDGIDYTTYATQTACDAPSPAAKTAGTWDTSDSTCSAPMTGATSGVTYSGFTTQASCTSTSQKLVETWSTWSNADDNTLNAWIFAAGKAPRLRYADYDGAGTTFDCSMFPAGVTCGANGDPLPGQPAQ